MILYEYFTSVRVLKQLESIGVMGLVMLWLVEMLLVYVLMCKVIVE